RLHPGLGECGGPCAGDAAGGGGGAGLGLRPPGDAERAGTGSGARAAGPRLATAGKPALSARDPLADQVEAILRRASGLMMVMETARALELPDWLVFSGAVYQPVVNHLTGRPLDYGLKRSE